VIASLDTALILGDANRVGMLFLGDRSLLAYSGRPHSFGPPSAIPSSGRGLIRTASRSWRSLRSTPQQPSCLHVHGQVRQFDKPFQLTGTSRSAAEVDWAPFHRCCRTSIALYFNEYDMGVTDRMKEVSNRALQSPATS